MDTRNCYIVEQKLTGTKDFDIMDSVKILGLSNRFGICVDSDVLTKTVPLFSIGTSVDWYFNVKNEPWCFV